MTLLAGSAQAKSSLGVSSSHSLEGVSISLHHCVCHRELPNPSYISSVFDFEQNMHYYTRMLIHKQSEPCPSWLSKMTWDFLKNIGNKDDFTPVS
jgi:hypothetical protein